MPAERARADLPPRCAQLADALAAAADGTPLTDPSARAHVETCLRCQAELVQYRRLLRTLRALRADVLEPAPGLLAEVLAAVGSAGERQALRSLLSGRRAAYAAGVAAAAAAAGVGVLVLSQRGQRGRRGPGLSLAG